MPQTDNTTAHTRRLGIQQTADRLRRQHRNWPPERIAAEAKRQWASKYLARGNTERSQ